MRRLLILSCSQRKSSDTVPVPAIRRYNGPAFLLLRRFMRERPDAAKQLDVYILSAELGIISDQQLIQNYDRAITRQRAAELNETVVSTLSNIFNTEYAECCVVLSKHYLAALEGWQRLAPSDMPITVITAAQGLRLTKLKEWLYGEQGNVSRRSVRVIEPHGVARLRGIEIRLTPSEIFERLDLCLFDGRNPSNRFKEWYVDVGTHRISLKWLVSILTGLPVSSFSTGEARRVLCQLGLTPKHVARAIDGNHSI